MVKIAILGSTQHHNPYCCAPVTEGEVMGELSGEVVRRLNKSPVQALRLWTDATQGDTYAARTDQANYWGADYLVALHTDSAGDKRGYTGSLSCHLPEDDAGKLLGAAIQNRLARDLGWPNAGTRARSDLYVLNGFPQPSTLVEVANHSDPDDCGFLLDNLGRFAESIAGGVTDYLGITTETREDDMIRIIDFDDGTDAIYLIDLGARTKWWIPSGEVLAWLRDGFGIPMITGMQPFGQFFDNIDLVEKEQDQRYQEIKVLMARAASSHSTGADASEIVDEISKRLAQ